MTNDGRRMISLNPDLSYYEYVESQFIECIHYEWGAVLLTVDLH